MRCLWLMWVAATLSGLACSNGRDRTIAELQSERPDVRAMAVNRLARNFEADDVSLFSQAARDPVSMVRAEAMTALGKTEDARVVDLLGEGLSDADEQVQAAAAMALASFKTDKARGYLTLQYSRRGASTRRAIVRALKAANIPGAMASVVAAEAKSIWERNLRVLSDGSLPERIGAAEELGRSGRPEAVNRLVPLLKDKHVGLAAAAARGLGWAGDVRAVPAVTLLLDENVPELREAACEALGRLGDASVLPKLIAVAEERSPASASATKAILLLPPSPAVDAALCGLMQSLTPGEALQMGRELQKRSGCPLGPIKERLKSPTTAKAALMALAALGVTDDLSAEVGPLSAAADAETRRWAVEALAEMGPPARLWIQKAWDNEAKALEPRRQDWVPEELPQTFAPGFAPVEHEPRGGRGAQLKELLGKVQARDQERLAEAGKRNREPIAPHEIVDDVPDEDLQVLAAIVRAEARLHLEGAVAHARLLSQETSSQARAAGLSALIRWGEDGASGLWETDRQVQASVAQALVESDPSGQLTVLKSINQMTGDRSRLLESFRTTVPPTEAAALLEPLVREGGAEAGFAATLLGRMAATSAVPTLLSLLKEPSTIARREILLALGRIGDAKASEVIARDLYSDSAEVRCAAARALGQLKAVEHREAIDALRGDYSLQVRTAATEALAPFAPAEGVDAGP